MKYKSLIAASLIAIFLYTAVFAQSTIIGMIIKNANLRSGPSTSYAVVGTVKAGEDVTIVGKDSSSSWYHLDDGHWIAAFLVEVVGTVTPSSTLRATKTPQPALTSISTPIPTTKPTQRPSSTSTPLPEDFILDMSALIGKLMPQVEKVLGEPVDITPFDPGDSVIVTGAGEWRDYQVGKYWFFTVFDAQGKLHSIMLEGGLEDHGYTLADWKLVLPIVGIDTIREPDKTALAAVIWNNLEGNKVDVSAEGISNDSPIWTVQISMLE